ncbi:MAG: heme biosynthesis HemY N-terminal domain-containing protein [Stagnimonas sp.]|nr:heme biosynthesis HemY N-terminal domain-containing protein [Stagnimonas sp.]
MLPFFFVLALALGVGVFAAFQLRAETGYVLVSYGPWVLETSLLGFIAAVVFVVLAVFYGFKLIRAGVALPGRWKSHHDRRKADAAQLSFERGLLRLFEGQWKRAEVELVRRASDHHAQHLNYLAAARAAQRVGAPERRDAYLQRVREIAPKLDFALLLTQAELQRERGEFALLRDTARSLRQKDGQHAYAMELLAESHAELGEWAGLRGLLAESSARKALTDARWRELSMQAAIELLRAAIHAARLSELKAVWDATPADVRAVPEVTREYATGLARLNADAEARAFIESQLAKRWDDVLVRLYGPLYSEDPIAQLATLERWLQEHGEKTALLETAGQVCLKNKLWGKAKSYLEAVIATAPTPSAYLELARLCEMTQAPQEAQAYYKAGLELAAQPR